MAGELFPVLLEYNEGVSLLGISVGFLVAMMVIYGLEHLVDYIENMPEEGILAHIGGQDKSTLETSPMLTFPAGLDGGGILEMTQMSNGLIIDDEHVQRASEAMSVPEHRGHIRSHLSELMENILTMEKKSNELSREGVSSRQREKAAEEIDELVHSLQYKLDHCRRLLQGAEADAHGALQIQHDSHGLVTEQRKERIRKGISGLKLMGEHLLEHIQEGQITNSVLKEMHMHMQYMDKQIETFHESIENVGSRWTKGQLVATEVGDKLPLTLIIPVCMDCFVDGFLIGISSSISLKAGIVLGFANSLEMAFLGMAYTARLIKCTGSPVYLRRIALYGPPFIMFLASGLGALLGDTVSHIRAVFIGLVAFGAVALLFLVCNELLIEAHNAQGEEERWWISALVFLGIYVVLVMDHAF